MSDRNVTALVGSVGGAGTTRLCLEFAAMLARAGREAAVIDASYATQGLATAVPGRIDPDVTGVVTEDDALAAATARLDLDVPGTVAVAPARAPFERLSRAKTSDCARRLAGRLSAAGEGYDAVLVDVPPVAANQALAAVTAADRVAVVAPDSQRGRDALAPTRDRLRDVGAPADILLANFATEGDRVLETVDAAVPTAETEDLAAAPTGHAGEGAFASAVADAVETATGCDLDVSFEEPGVLAEYLPD